jgi:F-type H+-transporting ATPase subunit b
MTRSARRRLLILIFGACLMVFAGAGFASSLDAVSAPPEEGEAAAEGENHGHEAIYRWINFALLAGGLFYVLRKPLGAFFADRSSSIQKSLEEGRKALEASQAQLKAVEEKLQHLDEEIAEFKLAAAREMGAERERMRQATAQEAEKILQAARSQMDTATRAAQLDMRIYAARLAVELAEELIRQRLDDAARQRLVGQFLARLETAKPKH